MRQSVSNDTCSTMPPSTEFEKNLLTSFDQDFDSTAALKGNLAAVVISSDGLTRKESPEGNQSLNQKEQEIVFAAACLHRFIRQNFTGPPDTSNTFPAFASLINESARAKLREEDLSYGLNRPFVNCRDLELLWGAKLLLLDDKTLLLDGFESVDWWAIRALLVWQRVLEEPSVELKTAVELRAERWQQSALFNSLSADRRAQFHIEYAYSLLYYFEFDKATEALEQAMKAVGIEVEFGGALGKRTRFQQNDIAQLILQVHFSDELKEYVEEKEPFPPHNCPLDDDTLLETVQISDDRGEMRRLTAIQQACVLAVFELDRRTHHNDELLLEKLGAYVDKVISDPICWSIQFSALLTRSVLEKGKSRRVGRACSQTETLVALCDRQTDQPSADPAHRVRFALASNLPPWWKVHTAHAEVLRSLGCTREALNIYEKVNNWDQVVDCYKSLGKLDSAEHIVRKLIEEKEDPIYYCLLGDITLNQEHYEKAWEISKHRSARAQLSLGQLLLHQRNQVEEAFNCIERSLQLQPLQQGAWFTLGHCAWRLERFADAARAYHRCVGIEPDNFEAWNNLSAAYVRMQQKERALKILQESIKYNYDHWKIWENYMLIAVDTGAYVEAVKAFHRLLDLRTKHEDVEVLQILTKEALLTGADDNDVRTTLRAELTKLFGRLTSKQTTNAKVWRCYAQLNAPKDENDVDQLDKYAHLLQRAHQTAIQEKDWEQDVEGCIATLESAALLANTQMAIARLKGSKETASRLKGSVRMTLRPVITLVKKRYDAFDGTLSEPRIVEPLKALEDILLLNTT